MKTRLRIDKLTPLHSVRSSKRRTTDQLLCETEEEGLDISIHEVCKDADVKPCGSLACALPVHIKHSMRLLMMMDFHGRYVAIVSLTFPRIAVYEA